MAVSKWIGGIIIFIAFIIASKSQAAGIEFTLALTLEDAVYASQGAAKCHPKYLIYDDLA